MVRSTSHRRVGIVLGGGGAVGAGFHRGVLAALEDVTGFDARSADVIVGTSSGATVAGLLRAGLGGGDLAAGACGRAASEHARQLDEQRAGRRPQRAAATGRPDRPDVDAERIGRSPAVQRGPPAGRWIPGLLPASGRGVLTAARRQGVRHPGAVLGALLPAGRVPTVAQGGPLDRLFPDGWPRRSLWICAVRVEDGSRVLFGRTGEPSTDVPTAVAASCALPGWFAPVTIDKCRYVDGAVWSATNADALVDERLDLVVISAPLSGSSSLLHRWQGRQMRQEVGRLDAAGVEAVVIEPTPADVRVMGWNIMDRRRRPAVTRHVRASMTERLLHGDLGALAALG